MASLDLPNGAALWVESSTGDDRGYQRSQGTLVSGGSIGCWLNYQQSLCKGERVTYLFQNICTETVRIAPLPFENRYFAYEARPQGLLHNQYRRSSLEKGVSYQQGRSRHRYRARGNWRCRDSNHEDPCSSLQSRRVAPRELECELLFYVRDQDHMRAGRLKRMDATYH